MSDNIKYLLDETRIPKYWYNIMADLPKPPPAVLHPGTLQPIGPDDLAPLFPMSLIMQEVSQEREIEIHVFKVIQEAKAFIRILVVPTSGDHVDVARVQTSVMQ